MKVSDLINEAMVPDTVIYGISSGKKTKVIKALQSLESMVPTLSYKVRDYNGDVGVFIKSGKNDDEFKDLMYKAVKNIDKWAEVSE